MISGRSRYGGSFVFATFHKNWRSALSQLTAFHPSIRSRQPRERVQFGLAEGGQVLDANRRSTALGNHLESRSDDASTEEGARPIMQSNESVARKQV